MILKRTTFPSIISHISVISLISAITIFTTYAWGRYVLMGCIAAILFCDTVRCKGKYRVYFSVYLVITLLFIVFTTVSSLWALNGSRVLEKSRTLIEIFLMVFVLCNHYCTYDDSVRQALRDIKIASFVIVLYTLIFYGIPQLMLMAAAEERLEGEFANVNTIGILAAIGAIIQFDEMFAKKKFTFLSLLCIPSLLLIAVTQSRKALVMVVMGVALILWMRNIHSKSFFKTLFRLIVYVAIGVVVISFVLSQPVFAGLMERMQSWFNSFTGEGKVDNSTLVRNQMIQAGWETFLKYPIFGIGIGSSGEITLQYFNKDTYLHNNFIELLASGGIVGFAIYYSMYVYLIVKFWKYRKSQNKAYIICLTLLLVLLAMDYGRVSYYAKTQYIFLMALFLEINDLKKTAADPAKLPGSET